MIEIQPGQVWIMKKYIGKIPVTTWYLIHSVDDYVVCSTRFYDDKNGSLNNGGPYNHTQVIFDWMTLLSDEEAFEIKLRYFS
jgi:hypothetical protein